MEGWYENVIKVTNHLLPLTPNRADPNLKNEEGETTLHAKPELQDNDGKTAYDHAMDRNVKSRLVKSDRVDENFIKVTNHLLPLTPNGADPNFKHEGGETRLHIASEDGKFEVVEHLTNGADPKLRNKEGKTPNLNNNNGYREFMKKHGLKITVISIIILIACALIVYFIQNSTKGMIQIFTVMEACSCSRSYSI